MSRRSAPIAESPVALCAHQGRRARTAVLAAMPDATIFRPSIMFGPEDDFFNRFAALARMSAGAAADRRRRRRRFQPVFVGDVAEAIARAVDGAAQGRRDLRARRAGGADLQGADGIRARRHRAQAPAGAAAVRARQAAGDLPAIHAEAAADARPGRAAARPTTWCRRRPRRRPHARRRSASSRGDGGDRAVAISGASARPGSSRPGGCAVGAEASVCERLDVVSASASAIRPSAPTTTRHQREQREAVALHVAEERLHHDPGAR